MVSKWIKGGSGHYCTINSIFYILGKYCEKYINQYKEDNYTKYMEKIEENWYYIEAE